MCSRSWSSSSSAISNWSSSGINSSSRISWSSSRLSYWSSSHSVNSSCSRISTFRFTTVTSYKEHTCSDCENE